MTFEDEAGCKVWKCMEPGCNKEYTDALPPLQDPYPDDAAADIADADALPPLQDLYPDDAAAADDDWAGEEEPLNEWEDIAVEVAEQAEEDEAIDAEEDEMIDAAGDGEPTRTGRAGRQAEQFQTAVLRHVLPRDYVLHKDDQCPKCGEKRFKKVETAAGAVYKPRKRFWYFGLANILRDRMFSDPTWCRLRGTGRNDPEQQYDYWHSPDFQRVNEATGAKLTAEGTSASVYDVGVDWGQPFHFKQWSSGYVALRCADVPHVFRSIRDFCHLLVIIPGPDEPKSIDPYADEMFQDFKKYGPSGEGLEVVEHLKDAGGVVVPKTLRHYVVLGGVYADTPAQRKLSKWMGHSAYLGCGHCMILGTWDHGMYFQGYTEPRAAGAFHRLFNLDIGGSIGKAYCGTERIKVSHAKQWERAVRMEQPGTAARDVGCHGISPVLKYLDYVDYNNIWVIPMSHALIYGAVKLFWGLLLTRPTAGDPAAWCYLPRVNRNIMKDRARHFTNTRDFNRSYRDIMWTLLREATLHYVCATPGNGTPEEQQAAHQKLQQYAKLVSQHFGIKACTYNLHLLVCRAADQEKARGQSALELELWVENMVQLAKSTTKFRTTANPEILLVNQVLLTEAIKKAPTIWPYLRDYNQLVYGSSEGAPDRGNLLDQPYAEDNTGFIGSGARPKTAELVKPRDFPQDGWTDAACDTATYTVYKAVDIKGIEIVLSRAYLMARSRVSYFVRVDYEGDGTYVARISKFLKVSRGDAEGGSALRIAVADLFKIETREGYQGELIIVKGPQRGPYKKDYPMSVDHIAHKLLFCDATRGDPDFRQNLWCFPAYSNTYTKRNPELE
ncbi:hypothetical protein WJX75_004081 [Coccomyxa subellipsoidea]